MSIRQYAGMSLTLILAQEPLTWKRANRSELPVNQWLAGRTKYGHQPYNPWVRGALGGWGSRSLSVPHSAEEAFGAVLAHGRGRGVARRRWPRDGPFHSS